MMAIFLLLALAWGTLAAPVEVGARFGIASFVGSEHTDGTRASVSIPGASSLYAVWFPSQKISFGPKCSFHYTSGDFGYWSSYIGALAGYYPRGHTRSGLFTEAELGRLGHGPPRFPTHEPSSALPLAAPQALPPRWPRPTFPTNLPRRRPAPISPPPHAALANRGHHG